MQINFCVSLASTSFIHLKTSLQYLITCANFLIVKLSSSTWTVAKCTIPPPIKCSSQLWNCELSLAQYNPETAPPIQRLAQRSFCETAYFHPFNTTPPQRHLFDSRRNWCFQHETNLAIVASSCRYLPLDDAKWTTPSWWPIPWLQFSTFRC